MPRNADKNKDADAPSTYSYIDPVHQFYENGHYYAVEVTHRFFHADDCAYCQSDLPAVPDQPTDDHGCPAPDPDAK